MWHTVGPHSRAVYWRRRVVVLTATIAVVLLVVLTVRALAGGDNGAPAAGGTTGSSGSSGSAPVSRVTPPGTGSATTSPAGAAASGTGPAAGGTPTPSATGAAPGGSTGTALGQSPGAPAPGPGTAGSTASGTVPGAPPACAAAQLAVQGVVGAPQYHVGDQPLLILQVTNTGPAPCLQDVADSQIELRVYNGASRVWGSHDCQIEPGTDMRVLDVNKPAGFSIQWSGLTSQPGCPAGSRQRVGAGTYTLYASLSGHDGKAAQFSLV